MSLVSIHITLRHTFSCSQHYEYTLNVGFLTTSHFKVYLFMCICVLTMHHKGKKVHMWTHMSSKLIKYLRAGNVCAVVEDMRNRNHHPARIKSGEDNDLTDTWFNEVPILWEFCYRYLNKEGLTATSNGVDDLFA